MTLARIDDLGDRLVVVNMNVSKRGALTPELYDKIQEAFEIASEHRDRIGAVILTAEGGFFCAGGDLGAIRERMTLPEDERRDRIEALHACIRAIRGSVVPVIASVEGGAAGAGLSFALACDLIVAAEGAQFTAAYVKAGLVPDGGLTASMARTIPRQLAMEMCLLAKPLSAERMAELGVVNAVVPPGKADGMAHQMADALGRGPGGAQFLIRKMVSEAYDATEDAQLDTERDNMAFAIGAPEAREGIDAFLTKRRPDFKSSKAR